MSVGRVLAAILAVVAIAVLYYTGVWHFISLFLWQHPILTWLPLLVFLLVGVIAGFVRAALGEDPWPPPRGEPAAEGVAGVSPAGEGAAGVSPAGERSLLSLVPFYAGPGIAAALGIFLIGLYFMIFAPPVIELGDVDYEFVDSLPQRTQPRLLPRTSVDDDPRFAQADEIHLVRDPETGNLLWTGEWEASAFNGESAGVVVKNLDDVVSQSRIVMGGFEHSVSGFGPNTMINRAKRMHPFSRIQYPVLIPTADGVIAMAPYVGYEGFPLRRPYLKGVLVYHQDGTLEDLTPEEAAARPELALSGRIVPETVARKEAEAVARATGGEIKDAEGNKQPFLTAIDRDRTVWLTIINDKQREGGVRAIVLADSSSGETEVWRPAEGEHLVSTEDVINQARALPLQWEATRCCDSDGHSYTVKLREVVEPRLAFKDGKPYYLVTIAPTDELALSRQIEYTLLIDAETGKKLDQFDHVSGGPAEDARLQRFFQPEPSG